MRITLTVSYKTESRKKILTVRCKNGNKVPPISYIYSSLIESTTFSFCENQEQLIKADVIKGSRFIACNRK